MQTQIKEIRWKSQYNLIRLRVETQEAMTVMDSWTVIQSIAHEHLFENKKVFSGQATG